MAKDVHEQRVRTIGTVQFFPLPIGANSRPLRRGVNFFETPVPLSIATNSTVYSRVEVAMPAIVVPPKDDAGSLPIRLFMQKSIY